MVLYLASHKDITKQKLHEQHQHQLQLIQQQQQLHISDNVQASQDHTNANDGGQQQNQHQQQLSSNNNQTDQNNDANTDNHTTNLGGALMSYHEFQLGGPDGMGGDDDFNACDYEDGDDSDDHDKHTANNYSRRRSRAVLYQLSGHYGYRRSVNMKSKLKLNNVCISLTRPPKIPLICVCSKLLNQ